MGATATAMYGKGFSPLRKKGTFANEIQFGVAK